MLVVQAVDSSGNVDFANQSTVNATVLNRQLDSSETGPPSSFQLSGGQYQQGLLFNRVQDTQTGTTIRFNAVSSQPTPGSNGLQGEVQFYFYTYFSVIASIEGLVGGVTSCGNTVQPNDHFVALPQRLCDVPVVVRNFNTDDEAFTNVKDVGPWFPNTPSPHNSNPCDGHPDPYWNTGGIPRAVNDHCSSDHAGIDLATGTAADIHIRGLGPVLWMFNH